MRLQSVLAENVLERDLQENVRVLANMRGWLYYHTHRSRHSPAGFPDVIAIKEDVGAIVVAECKRQKAKPTPEQQRWLQAFTRCGIEGRLWTPSMWNSGEIEAVLW